MPANTAIQVIDRIIPQDGDEQSILTPYQTKLRRLAVRATTGTMDEGLGLTVTVKRNSDTVLTQKFHGDDVIEGLDLAYVPGDLIVLDALLASYAENAFSITPSGGTAVSFRLRALSSGAGGDSITLAIDSSPGVSQPLTVSVAGSDITVSVATDSAGDSTTTFREMLSALMANGDVKALVELIIITPDTDEAWDQLVIDDLSATALSGGAASVPSGNFAIALGINPSE